MKIAIIFEPKLSRQGPGMLIQKHEIVGLLGRYVLSCRFLYYQVELLVEFVKKQQLSEMEKRKA